MRRVRSHGQSPRRQRPSPGDLRAVLAVWIFAGESGSVLRARAPDARDQLLLRDLLSSDDQNPNGSSVAADLQCSAVV